MVQQIKALNTESDESDDLSSSPKIHVVEKEN